MSGGGSQALDWLRHAEAAFANRAFADAAAGFERAVAADPALARGWLGLASAQEAAREYGAAIAAWRRLDALAPGEPAIAVNLGKLLHDLGHTTEAVNRFRAAAASTHAAARAMAMANLACIAPEDPALDNDAVRDLRVVWVDEIAATAQKKPPRRPRGPGERLRLGYYGSFFDQRNWMKMYLGVINAHDRERFEINLIVDGAVPTTETGLLDYPDDRIWDVTGVPNATLADLIAEAEIDVLIDMNGYSHQMRLPLPVWRAAPVQLAWLGMYGTTGARDLDAVITDEWALPIGEEGSCVERVRRVPGTYQAFHFFYDAPDVAPMPFLRTGQVTFGGMAPAYKINDGVIASWSRILNGVPGARLLLRNRGMDHASNRLDFLARFAAHGIRPERLILEGGADHDTFLRTYDRVDIALDSFPYNGGTSTAEALWQGVPLLTFNGDRWASRTSRTLLMAAGLGEWVAEDREGFEALATRLGRDPSGLVERRLTQRAKVAASAACDTTALCRALESIYLEESAAKR